MALFSPNVYVLRSRMSFSFFTPPARLVELKTLNAGSLCKPARLVELKTLNAGSLCKPQRNVAAASKKTPPPPLMEKDDNEKEEEEEEKKKTTDKKKKGGGFEKLRFAAQILLYLALVVSGGGGGGGGWGLKTIGPVEINMVLLGLLPIIRLMGLKTTLKTSIGSGSLDVDLFGSAAEKKKPEEDDDAILDDSKLYLGFLKLLFRAESPEVAKRAMDSAWTAFEDFQKKKMENNKGV